MNNKNKDQKETSPEHEKDAECFMCSKMMNPEHSLDSLRDICSEECRAELKEFCR